MQSEKDALIERYAGDAFKNRNNNDLTIGVWRQHFVEFADKLAALSAAEPVVWVSPVDLRAWKKAKAGEIWAWSENIEGQCVPLYTGPQASSMDALPDVGQWTDDDRARVWREAFETMHQRAMKAENSLSAAAPPAPSVAVKALQAVRSELRVDASNGKPGSISYEVGALHRIVAAVDAALSAQVQDVAGLESNPVTLRWWCQQLLDIIENHDITHDSCDEEIAMLNDIRASVDPAAPAKQEG